MSAKQTKLSFAQVAKKFMQITPDVVFNSNDLTLFYQTLYSSQKLERT
jgi:hypothetical protein